MAALQFKRSDPLTLGVELELQILNRRDFNLTRGAPDLLALVGKMPHRGDVKPEITESMVEISTGIHRTHTTLLEELLSLRDVLRQAAERLNLCIAGGGAHPFQQWSDQRIFDRPRYQHLHELYGYLAKQFTVFGQHIHVGCPDGDAAMYLVHGLSRYIPHFIALAASSPFYQGADTLFASSRLNVVNAFPLSGYMPLVETWSEFNTYFEDMQGFGIVESMKDFYWDIRPKPEYGTIEIRVCDTPLTVERAALLAAYAQTLSSHLLRERSVQPSVDLYRVYGYNRFLACRFGFEAAVIDAADRTQRPLKVDIVETLRSLMPDAADLGTARALLQLRDIVLEGSNDSTWLRRVFSASGSLTDVAHAQSDAWMQHAATGAPVAV
ncbi:MAG: glutamate--cysteine ligase [Betaproteobacteria bacterium]|nr:glutamate--cysteine ligase [Betaproteobacteria bacterium]